MRVMEQNVTIAIPQSVESGDDRRSADVRTLDAGKIRTGAGCRIRLVTPPVKRTADTGRIRMGAGCRIRPGIIG